MRSAGISWALVCVWLGARALAWAAEPVAAPAVDAPRAMSTNSLGMQFVEMAAADFLMGEENSHKVTGHHRTSIQLPVEYTNDRPAIPVRLTKSLWVATHEVTVGQFRKFVDATGYRTDAQANGRGAFVLHPAAKDESQRFALEPAASWKNPGFEQDDTHPVVCVSWHDAAAFCEWLSKTDEAVYRLPTEAEWECACRAGTTTIYSCGDDPDAVYACGNVGDASLEAELPGTVARQRADHLGPGDGDGFVFTAPVGRFKPNAFGLYDMHGNVWEWCRDRYFDRHYNTLNTQVQQLRRAKQPAFAVDPPGPASTPIDKYGDWRSLRGGSWYVSPIGCRCAARSYAEAGDSFSYIGFRVVREVK